MEKSCIFGFLRQSVGNPRRGVALHPSLRRGWGAKMAPPRVRYGVALLRRDVDTVHSEHILEFFFPNTSYSYTDSLRTLINV